MGVVDYAWRVVKRMLFLAFCWLILSAVIYYHHALVQRILDDTIGAFFSWISGGL